MSNNLNERKRNLTLLPCYIDTNILINATLESEPYWQNENKTDYQREKDKIDSSYKLLHNWNPDILFTSRYSIAEFFMKGQTGRFGKSFEELNNILQNNILTNCTILQAKFSNIEYPSGLGNKDDWIALEIDWKFDNFRENLIVTKDGKSSHSRSGGLKNTGDNLFDYKEGNLVSISYKCPTMEYLIFNEICKIEISKNIGLKDILHFIYIKEHSIGYFVTHDPDLRDVISELKLSNYISCYPITAKKLIEKYLKQA
jgi:predicted nucleic acid-binding protein